MNMMVILYNGDSIDDKQGVMESVARVLEKHLGTYKVRFITPESSDLVGYKEDAETTNQEAIDNAVVLVSEIGKIGTSSIADFSTILTLNAIRGHKELLNALFVLNHVDSVGEITKEVKQKYRFSKFHLMACKSVFSQVTGV